MKRAHVALVDGDAPPVQLALDLYPLAMLVFVLPADEGQYIQTMGAEGQADQQDAAGIVMPTRIAARWPDTFLAPAAITGSGSEWEMG